MEAKINIAEILKDKPQGTKLYSPIFGKLRYEYLVPDLGEFTVVTSDNTLAKHSFRSDSRYNRHGEPLMLLPSDKMRDWRKFAWKKGDVLTSKDNDTHIIFEKFEDDAYTRFKGKQYLWKRFDEEDYSKEESQMLTALFEKANDYEVQTYINTIEERLGGKLNLEPLVIDKQPEFKDGDIVVYGKSVAICRKIYKHTHCFYVSIDETFGLLFDYNMVSSEECRFAEEEEKQELFNALEKKGKAWDAEKKQIVDLKPKWTPKPFDRVITRGDNDSIWTANIFSHIDRYGQYVAIGCIGGYPHCIPYNEETVKLIGTTDEWKGDNK